MVVKLFKVGITANLGLSMVLSKLSGLQRRRPVTLDYALTHYIRAKTQERFTRRIFIVVYRLTLLDIQRKIFIVKSGVSDRIFINPLTLKG